MMAAEFSLYFRHLRPLYGMYDGLQGL